MEIGRVLFLGLGLAVTALVLYFYGRSFATATDKKKLDELNARYASKYRFLLTGWGFQLTAQALEDHVASEDEALEIGKAFWLDGAKLRGDRGQHWTMSFLDAGAKPAFRLTYMMQEGRLCLAVYKLVAAGWLSRARREILKVAECR
jgi:hypothetical protein